MAETHFKAFLSCSFEPEDERVVDFFRHLIESFDIDPVLYNWQEIGRLTDKIKEHISKCDCLIAVVTRRKKIEGSDLWTCPDWIHHELAIANAYNKPIAIFVEQNVKLDGLLASEERKEAFSRDDLLRGIDRTTRFLYHLRNYLDSTECFERMHIPVLLRHFMHVEEDLQSRDATITRCEALIECLADKLEAIHHSSELDETTPGLSLQPRKFRFVCKEAPLNTKVTASVMMDTERKYVWRILFNPPLKRGDTVRYAFKKTCPTFRPYTYEDVLSRIQGGTYNFADPVCMACDWRISYPTAEFIWEMQFPEGYELGAVPAVDVTTGVAQLKAEAELKRITDARMFSAEKIIDRWRLSLHLTKPLHDHTYWVYYVPPRAASLAAVAGSGT